MPNKGRLAANKKIELVEKYLLREISVAIIMQEYGIAKQTFQEWVRLYKSRGVSGLVPSSVHRHYSTELKQRAVQEYLSGTGSLNDICTKYNISNHSMVQRWIKKYNNHEDFKRPNSGGAIYMAKGKKTTLEERIKIVSHCIANNKDYGLAIETHGVSYQQIYSWVKKYETGGVDALSDRRGKRKDKASMSEIEKLRAQLKLKEAENLRLQMENELLKKLEALERGIDED